MTKCVIFDCDGTLVDSELLCNRCLALKLKELGIVEEAGTLVRRYRGAKLATILVDIGTRHETTIPNSFVTEYRALTASFFEKLLRPTIGVKAALNLIPLPKCVASSGLPDKILQALRVTGLVDHFSDRIFSSYAVNSWKPDPGLFLYAASQMGFSPCDCAVVDDSLLGIQAAASAGMRSFFFDPDGTNVSMDSPLTTSFRDMSVLPELLADEEEIPRATRR
jgi:HAD superfamily hydrolase (TIGR01509 family)